MGERGCWRGRGAEGEGVPGGEGERVLGERGCWGRGGAGGEVVVGER